MAIQIQLRSDTELNWTNINPILAQGEIGVELDTVSFKIGDGITPWNNLDYSQGGTSIHNNLINLDGGDSTANEFYHLTSNEYEKLVGTFTWFKLDSDITVESNKNYLVDLSAKNLIITLPLTPTSNDFIFLYNLTNNLTNNYTITINKNGSLINGLDENLILKNNELNFSLLFDENNNNWIIIHNNNIDGGYF